METSSLQRAGSPLGEQPRETAERRHGETQIPINLIVARCVAPGYVPGIGFQKWDNYLKD